MKTGGKEPRPAQFQLASLIPGLLFLGGIGLRCHMLMFQEAVWHDQALYCQILKNLIEGRLQFDGSNLFNYYVIRPSGLEGYNHPLLPIVSLPAAYIFGIEPAIRLTSFLGSCLFLFCFYLLAKKFLSSVGQSASLALVAFHPGLVFLSVSAFSESLFLGLLFLLMVQFLRYFSYVSCRTFLSSGLLAILTALVYLTKPEGILVAIVAPALIFLFHLRKWNLRVSAVHICLFYFVFLCCIVPYKLYLFTQNEQYAPNAKLKYHLILHKRVKSDGLMSAYFKLNNDGSDTLTSKQMQEDSMPELLIKTLPSVIGNSFARLPETTAVLSPGQRGSKGWFILLALLVFIAFFRARTKREKLILAGFLCLYYLATLPYSPILFLKRPLYVCWPFLIYCICYALERAFQSRIHRSVAYAGVLAIGLFYFPKAYTYQIDYSKRFKDYPKIGKWLAENTSESSLISLREPALAYYSKRKSTILPIGSAKQYHRFFKEKSVTHVVSHRQHYNWKFQKLGFQKVSKHKNLHLYTTGLK